MIWRTFLNCKEREKERDGAIFSPFSASRCFYKDIKPGNVSSPFGTPNTVNLEVNKMLKMEEQKIEKSNFCDISELLNKSWCHPFSEQPVMKDNPWLCWQSHFKLFSIICSWKHFDTWLSPVCMSSSCSPLSFPFVPWLFTGDICL